MMIVQDIPRWIASQCHNGPCKLLHSHSILHALGIILSISGVFRFYLDFQPLASLFLLLFNWVICIVLESMGVEILFQIWWSKLKFQNITPLRYFVLVLIFAMGLVNVYSMWQLCMEVHDCVTYQEYNWLIVAPPMWLTVSTAMLQTIILAICVPIQVIIIPLECNRNIPNINFNSRNVTLAVNLWLFVHFIYLSINYFYYSYIALLYRLFCTVWTFLYCYPGKTQSIYHWFKRRLPSWIRPILRAVRDNTLVIKVWRNLRAVIEQRRREGNMVDIQINLSNTLRSLRNVISDNVTSLWGVLCRNTKFWLWYLINCVLVGCLLIHIGCEALVALPIHHMMIMFIYLMFHHYFTSTNRSTTVITDKEPTIPVTNSYECTDTFKYESKFEVGHSMGTTVNLMSEIKQRVEDTIDNADNVNSLWAVLCRIAKFWLPCLISCILVGCPLIHIGCETLAIHHMMIMFMCLMFHHYFTSTNQSTAVITHNESTIPVTNSYKCTDKSKFEVGHSMGTTVNSISAINQRAIDNGRCLGNVDDHSCFISCSDGNSLNGVEKFEIQLPIQCNESHDEQ